MSAWSSVVLSLAYGAALVVGMLRLPSPDSPIDGTMFTIMEALILCSTPSMVVLMAVLHAWADVEHKVFGVLALVFTSLLTVVTCSLHFVILTISHQPSMAILPWMSPLLSFNWPSVAYALDILAWDVFFALAVWFAAVVFHGSRLASVIRWLLIVSGVLAFAGLSGVVLNDMQWRNIGIIGYGGVFPVAVLLIARLLSRSGARAA